jgi:hypothetical protein
MDLVSATDSEARTEHALQLAIRWAEEMVAVSVEVSAPTTAQVWAHQLAAEKAHQLV